MEQSRRHAVSWGETDAAGIVFYPNYFRWFDQGTHELLRDLEYPVSRMQDEGFIIPIIEAHGRFRAALEYENELTITSRVAELRTRAFRVRHVVSRNAEVVCEGYEVRICARREAKTGRLKTLPIPPLLRSALSRGTEHELSRIPGGDLAPE